MADVAAMNVFAVFPHFSRVFGALDDEEFFVIEGSCTIHPQRLLT